MMPAKRGVGVSICEVGIYAERITGKNSPSVLAVTQWNNGYLVFTRYPLFFVATTSNIVLASIRDIISVIC